MSRISNFVFIFLSRFVLRYATIPKLSAIVFKQTSLVNLGIFSVRCVKGSDGMLNLYAQLGYGILQFEVLATVWLSWKEQQQKGVWHCPTPPLYTLHTRFLFLLWISIQSRPLKMHVDSNFLQDSTYFDATKVGSEKSIPPTKPQARENGFWWLGRTVSLLL